MAQETPLSPSDVPRRRTDDMLAALAERVGARLSASTVFGAPVHHDGVTVVPVAHARFGFGAGGGGDASKGEDGEGAGAGGSNAPAGYIELKEGRTRFVPVVHPARMMMIVSGTILLALLILRPRTASRPAGRRRRR